MTYLAGLEPRLPTVEGCVHGIVKLDPPSIQCDGCGWVYKQQASRHQPARERMGHAIVICGIYFGSHPRIGRDSQRLCKDCWAAKVKELEA